jgi:hypothetical protein
VNPTKKGSERDLTKGNEEDKKEFEPQTRLHKLRRDKWTQINADEHLTMRQKEREF